MKRKTAFEELFSKPFLLSPCRFIKDPAVYWQFGKELFICYIALSLLEEIHLPFVKGFDLTCFTKYTV